MNYLRISAYVSLQIFQNHLCSGSISSCWIRASTLRPFAFTPIFHFSPILHMPILHSSNSWAEQISISDTPTLSAYSAIKLPSWAHTFYSTDFNATINFSLASTYQLSNIQHVQKRPSTQQCYFTNLFLQSLRWIPVLSQFTLWNTFLLKSLSR